MQNYERSRVHNIRVQSATDGSGEGDVTFIGAGQATTAGYVYVLTDDGEGGVSWTAADNDVNGKYEGLLAIAMGNDAGKGMLLRGAISVNDTMESVGQPVYIKNTAGRLTTTIPTSNGQVIRIVGYTIDGSGNTIYFNPDNTYIELS